MLDHVMITSGLLPGLYNCSNFPIFLKSQIKVISRQFLENWNFWKILENFSKIWFWTGQYFRNIIFDIYSGSQVLYNLKIIIFLRSKIPIKSFQIKFMSFHDFCQTSKLMPWFRNFQFCNFSNFKLVLSFRSICFYFVVCYLGSQVFRLGPILKDREGFLNWNIFHDTSSLVTDDFISVGDSYPTELLDSLD